MKHTFILARDGFGDEQFYTNTTILNLRRFYMRAKNGTSRSVGVIIESLHCKYLEDRALEMGLEPGEILERLIEDDSSRVDEWEIDETDDEVKVKEVFISHRHYSLLVRQAVERNLETEEYAETLIQIGISDTSRTSASRGVGRGKPIGVRAYQQP